MTPTLRERARAAAKRANDAYAARKATEAAENREALVAEAIRQVQETLGEVLSPSDVRVVSEPVGEVDGIAEMAIDGLVFRFRMDHDEPWLTALSLSRPCSRGPACMCQEPIEQPAQSLEQLGDYLDTAYTHSWDCTKSATPDAPRTTARRQSVEHRLADCVREIVHDVTVAP